MIRDGERDTGKIPEYAKSSSYGWETSIPAALL